MTVTVHIDRRPDLKPISMVGLLKEWSSPTNRKRKLVARNKPIPEEKSDLTKDDDDDDDDDEPMSVDDNNNNDDIDDNNNDINPDDDDDDDADEQEEKQHSRKSAKHRRFEPQLKSIYEEKDCSVLYAEARRRSDTLYSDDADWVTLLIRHEMENYARYRCLSQVQKFPSHRLFSKYYSTRPYLLAYSKCRAAAVTEVVSRHSPMYRRRASLRPAAESSGSRRGSLLPTELLRRKSLIPAEQSIGLLKSSSQGGEQAKMSAKKRSGLFLMLFSCVSRRDTRIN